eukprot:CAMPEP_0113916690 /NCGR_PEP_ID=MMETSP0780_2-20120614/32220_1 /TAXON_ID=652834 /ORGANISM="Palpitomonas bilix" /LENGTH=1206 /DNA_ID=CAMNT_0000915983 /DNA_START=551 /DNA_END=4168 /DNA_ORIENTATION=- /assembly_acc=CAM_ASM_000599
MLVFENEVGADARDRLLGRYGFDNDRESELLHDIQELLIYEESLEKGDVKRAATIDLVTGLDKVETMSAIDAFIAIALSSGDAWGPLRELLARQLAKRAFRKDPVLFRRSSSPDFCSSIEATIKWALSSPTGGRELLQECGSLVQNLCLREYTRRSLAETGIATTLTNGVTERSSDPSTVGVLLSSIGNLSSEPMSVIERFAVDPDRDFGAESWPEDIEEEVEREKEREEKEKAKKAGRDRKGGKKKSSTKVRLKLGGEDEEGGGEGEREASRNGSGGYESAPPPSIAATSAGVVDVAMEALESESGDVVYGGILAMRGLASYISSRRELMDAGAVSTLVDAIKKFKLRRNIIATGLETLALLAKDDGSFEYGNFQMSMDVMRVCAEALRRHKGHLGVFEQACYCAGVIADDGGEKVEDAVDELIEPMVEGLALLKIKVGRSMMGVGGSVDTLLSSRSTTSSSGKGGGDVTPPPVVIMTEGEKEEAKGVMYALCAGLFAIHKIGSVSDSASSGLRSNRAISAVAAAMEGCVKQGQLSALRSAGAVVATLFGRAVSAVQGKGHVKEGVARRVYSIVRSLDTVTAPLLTAVAHLVGAEATNRMLWRLGLLKFAGEPLLNKVYPISATVASITLFTNLVQSSPNYITEVTKEVGMDLLRSIELYPSEYELQSSGWKLVELLAADSMSRISLKSFGVREVIRLTTGSMPRHAEAVASISRAITAVGWQKGVDETDDVMMSIMEFVQHFANIPTLLSPTSKALATIVKSDVDKAGLAAAKQQEILQALPTYPLRLELSLSPLFSLTSVLKSLLCHSYAAMSFTNAASSSSFVTAVKEEEEKGGKGGKRGGAGVVLGADKQEKEGDGDGEDSVSDEKKKKKKRGKSDLSSSSSTLNIEVDTSRDLPVTPILGLCGWLREAFYTGSLVGVGAVVGVFEALTRWERGKNMLWKAEQAGVERGVNEENELGQTHASHRPSRPAMLLLFVLDRLGELSFNPLDEQASGGASESEGGRTKEDVMTSAISDIVTTLVRCMEDTPFKKAFAAEGGHTKLVQLLLAFSNDPSLEKRGGKTTKRGGGELVGSVVDATARTVAKSAIPAQSTAMLLFALCRVHTHRDAVAVAGGMELAVKVLKKCVVGGMEDAGSAVLTSMAAMAKQNEFARKTLAEAAPLLVNAAEVLVECRAKVAKCLLHCKDAVTVPLKNRLWRAKIEW